MTTPNGADAHQQADEQTEVPYAHLPTIDLMNAQLPTQGLVDQAQTAVPDSPQATTGQPPQTISSPSAPMPSAVPVSSPPSSVELEDNIVKHTGIK